MSAAVARALLAAALVLLPAAAGAAGTRPRARVEPSFGVRLGGVSAPWSVADRGRSAGGAGAYALWDIPGLLVDVSAELFTGPGARLADLGIGAYLPLLDGETTPYVGGGTRFGWTRFGGDGAFGLVPFAAAGLLLGRSWSPQVRLEVGWFVTVAKEEREAASIWAAPPVEERRASGFTTTVGIGF